MLHGVISARQRLLPRVVDMRTGSGDLDGCSTDAVPFQIDRERIAMRLRFKVLLATRESSSHWDTALDCFELPATGKDGVLRDV